MFFVYHYSGLTRRHIPFLHLRQSEPAHIAFRRRSPAFSFFSSYLSFLHSQFLSPYRRISKISRKVWFLVLIDPDGPLGIETAVEALFRRLTYRPSHAVALIVMDSCTSQYETFTSDYSGASAETRLSLVLMLFWFSRITSSLMLSQAVLCQNGATPRNIAFRYLGRN
jgi:hypothetical protein